ncbi:UvrD-helicase domain-containing protein [uncultured Marinococcus sp.]|uniref:UvrD-helicase domain-containing protein n=1 Tax=uncultured Marinococcus sp. TaxID=487012 RepID=UPI0026185D63|nr:ATP-dependent helicase [uncultured Marinococcus sp.]
MDLSIAIKLKDSDSYVQIDNHSKLYAGPGAGKTRFVVNHTNRILNNSKRLTNIKKIACITYTNIGVESIRSRLKQSENNVEVSTIHSFLYKYVVKPYIHFLKEDHFPSEKLDGHDDIYLTHGMLEDFLKSSQQLHLRQNKKDLANSLNKLIWKFNNGELELGYNKAYQGKVGSTYHIRKDSYYLYKKICWEKGLMGHEDVLYFAYRLLYENEGVRRIIRAKFPYIILDEFQDTSPLQAEIVKILSEKETIFTIVGDPCQAIFSFQGTDENLFSKFTLNNMHVYYLNINRRSTEEIINVLNHVRKPSELYQENPEKFTGEKPTLLIGEQSKAHQIVKNQVDENNVFILTYRNDEKDIIEYGFELSDDKEFDLKYDDGNRGWMIYFIISAIEFAKKSEFTEAIKMMNKAYKNKNQLTEKEILVNLKRFLNNYDAYYNESLKDFYNNFIFDHYGIKQRITSGKIKDKYEEVLFKEVAAKVNVTNHASNYKTIHGSKGDEFDNVFLTIPSKSASNNLDFLLSPDMKKEEHRVYYVALSRAIKKLYIHVEDLNEKLVPKIEKIGIKIERI